MVIWIVWQAKYTCACGESHQFVMSGTAVTLDPKLDYMYPVHQGSSLFGDFLYSGQYNQEIRQIDLLVTVLQKNVAVMSENKLFFVYDFARLPSRMQLITWFDLPWFQRSIVQKLKWKLNQLLWRFRKLKQPFAGLCRKLGIR